MTTPQRGELVDGRIAVRGQTEFWHDQVRDGVLGALKTAHTEPYKVPYYWRVELDRDRKLAVHGYWLNADALTHFPAPSHPVHHDKLITELPFPVETDLDALLGL